MKPAQEPKYKIQNGKIVNRASGEAIPDDEPIFIMRARDRHAAGAIWAYAERVANKEHREVVRDRVRDFDEFTAEHPERMHEPTTEASDLEREERPEDN